MHYQLIHILQTEIGLFNIEYKAWVGNYIYVNVRCNYPSMSYLHDDGGILISRWSEDKMYGM